MLRNVPSGPGVAMAGECRDIHHRGYRAQTRHRLLPCVCQVLQQPDLPGQDAQTPQGKYQKQYLYQIPQSK